MTRRAELVGRRYERLTVLERAVHHTGNTAWLCVCDCGAQAIVTTNSIQSGRTRSCGCLALETRSANGAKSRGKFVHRTHGQSALPEYKVWAGIKRRCENPNEQNYERYGGRGVVMCDEWREDFAKFLAHVGRKPTPEHSIDRIDPNGNYEPGNVRWATQKEQALNKRNSALISVNGETRNLVEWATVSGLSVTTLWNRIHRLGWTPEKAISEPTQGQKKRARAA